MAAKSSGQKRQRVPGRKPGPMQRDEVLRIWDSADDDSRKVILFCSRLVAREQGLVEPNTPLFITDRVF